MNDVVDESAARRHGDAPSTASAAHRADFSAQTGELYGIFVRNLLLSVCTLGIYRFWGKTRMRRFIWSRLSVHGEPFEYSGTGKELFVGFLKAAALIVLMTLGFAALRIWAVSYQPGFGKFVDWAQSIVFLALIYIGTFAAQRYRLGRTRWCGIRFHQSGSAWTYGLSALRGVFFIGITLGLYTPFLGVKLRKYQFDNLALGTMPFSFDGTGGALFKPFLIAWLLVVPTLGMSLFWYGARAMSFYAGHTSIGPVRFAMPVSSWQYFALKAGNLLMTILSIGLLGPVVTKRTINFWCRHLAICGEFDLAAIRQAAPSTERSGEGLASFLDIDAGLA